MASYNTEPGSEPSAPITISTFALLAHSLSWSAAAALNVSAAASTTFFPLFLNWLASFPIDVVFPTPFTPIIRITDFSFSKS